MKLMKATTRLLMVAALFASLGLAACDSDSGDDGNGNGAVCDPACAANEICQDGTCVPQVCVPECDGAVCGDDGCGGSCGTCTGEQFCFEGACVDEGTCEPACAAGEFCTPDNTCACTEATIAANCAGKQCGDDGCGGTCGTCAEGTCNEGTGLCETIDPDACSDENRAATIAENCAGKQCGSDGCGGTCAPGCAEGETCNAQGLCEAGPCEPVCDAGYCGPSNCEGVDCTCGAGETCNEATQQCEACAANQCGGACGDCPVGEQCTNGFCEPIQGDGLTCTGWFDCANACPQGPAYTECLVECDQQTVPEELVLKNALEACREANCGGCMTDPDPNTCYSTCTNEQCGDEFAACLASAFCNPAERDDCFNCGGLIGCQNECFDDQGNYEQSCIDACQDRVTGSGYFAFNDLIGCLQTACPPGSADDCWSQAQGEGGACNAQLMACIELTFCDPAVRDDCVDCGGYIGCQNDCFNPDGTYEQSCIDACNDRVTEDGYAVFEDLIGCLQTACPEGSPESCWSDAQQPDGACGDALAACAGGGGTVEPCDPTTSECLDCNGLIGCLNGCGQDSNCAQDCFGQATQEAQDGFNALIGCLQEECGDDDACWSSAQQQGGACYSFLEACVGEVTPPEACVPADHPDDPDYCLGCAGFIECSNGCTDDACAQACYARLTEDGLALANAAFSCLQTACPTGDATCMQAAQTPPDGACVAELQACAGGKGDFTMLK